jgi:hypothetical protein
MNTKDRINKLALDLYSMDDFIDLAERLRILENSRLKVIRALKGAGGDPDITAQDLALTILRVI